MKNIYLTLALGFLASAPAHAFKIAALGSSSFAAYTSNTTTANPQFGLGGGVLAEILPLGPNAAIEIGAFYLQRKYADTTSTVSFYTLEVPAVLRFYFWPFLSVAGGAYYSMTMGDVTLSNATASTSGPPSTFGLKSSDFGIAASVGVHIPVLPWLNVRTDLRYDFGTFNVSQVSGLTAKYNTFMGMLGVDFIL